jgi:hypothetical protein
VGERFLIRVGASKRNRSSYSSVRSEGGLRLQANLPGAPLGHIENILIFILEGPLRLLLGEVAVWN